MRIIAGEFSSRRIETRSGSETRPTLDKVREAVFSSLGGMFDGGCCLDLYAGSGAVGLEALSRGYSMAVFTDVSREAMTSIKKNIESLHVSDRCRTLNMKDMKALEILSSENAVFDLVYLDPPYKKEHNKEILEYLDQHNMIRKGGMAVIESLKEDCFSQDCGNLKFIKQKIYGISKITYYRAEESY
jgi:16S rRNA (guanine966-N2)-methyltransferase